MDIIKKILNLVENPFLSDEWLENWISKEEIKAKEVIKKIFFISKILILISVVAAGVAFYNEIQLSSYITTIRNNQGTIIDNENKINELDKKIKSNHKELKLIKKTLDSLYNLRVSK